MAPDLPVEIWFYIVSLLPRGQLHKLVGINRALFILAMDEIYQEVRFMDDDENVLKTFHQLKYPGIAKRVRHVYIRPGFFAKMDTPTQASSLGRLKAEAFCLLRKKVSPLPIEPREDIVLAAQRGLANCSSVEELTIVLHDLLPPPSFKPFLKTMWASIAANLRRLTVNATLAKFPLILNDGASRTFLKLTDLNINLAISRFQPVRELDELVQHDILPFINALRATLQSLAISSSELMDITPLFLGLGHFPRLQKLGIHLVMNRLTFVVPYALTSLITQHKETLQHFTLGLPDTSVLRNIPDFSYETWVTQEFCELDLPMLRSLHIEMSVRYPFSDTVTPSLSSARLPQLVSLTLSDAYMSHDDIEATFSDLFNGNQLESLQLRVKELNPQVLDTLAARFPHLVNLDLTFERRSVETLPIRPTYDAYDPDFEQQMMACGYPDWMLRNLKISRIHNSCPQPHYQRRTMEIVACCLPLPVTFGVENDCICPERQYHYDW